MYFNVGFQIKKRSDRKYHIWFKKIGYGIDFDHTENWWAKLGVNIDDKKS